MKYNDGERGMRLFVRTLMRKYLRMWRERENKKGR